MRLIHLRRPSGDDLEKWRERLDDEELSYPRGILNGVPAGGMESDTLVVALGSGEDCWERAKSGLDRWAHFDLGWANIATGGVAPEPGLNVLIFAAVLGVHVTSGCRVLSTHATNDGATTRYGFVYGSLDSHLESGEELFEVIRDEGGHVTYRIDVMARPGRWYTRLLRPVAERYRRRFRRDSAAALRRYVTG